MPGQRRVRRVGQRVGQAVELRLPVEPVAEPGRRPGCHGTARAPARTRRVAACAALRSTAGRSRPVLARPLDAVPVVREHHREVAQATRTCASSMRMPSRLAMPITSSSRSSANIRSTWASHRRPNASRLSTSSSTSTCGGRPASTGCSARIRWAKLCTVPMAAPSRSTSAASDCARRSSGVSVVVDDALERLPDPRPELARGGLGEGDRGDLAHRHARDRARARRRGRPAAWSCPCPRRPRRTAARRGRRW